MQSLPPEVFSNVLEYCDLVSIVRLSLTSRWLRWIATTWTPSPSSKVRDTVARRHCTSALAIAAAVCHTNYAVRNMRLPPDYDWYRIPRRQVALFTTPTEPAAGCFRHWLVVNPCISSINLIQARWSSEGVPLLYVRSHDGYDVVDARSNIKITTGLRLDLIANANICLSAAKKSDIAIFNVASASFEYCLQAIDSNARHFFGYQQTLYFIYSCSHKEGDEIEHSHTICVKSLTFSSNGEGKVTKKENWKVDVPCFGTSCPNYRLEEFRGGANENLVIIIQRSNRPGRWGRSQEHETATFLCADTGRTLSCMNLSDEFTRDMYLTSYHLIVARDRFDVFEMETFGQVGTFKPFGFDEPECRFAKLTNFCTSVDGRIWASSACNPSTSRHCMFELGMIVDGVPHAFITKMPSPIGYWLVYKDEDINAGNSTYSFKVEFIVLDKASHSGL